MKPLSQKCGRKTRGASIAIAVALSAAATPALAQCGSASWYALTSRTASGEMMDASQMTAAHRSLPFGTKLRVTNSLNGKSQIVRINDRGPFIKGRIIDVSKAAAANLGIIRRGHAPVCITVLGTG